MPTPSPSPGSSASPALEWHRVLDIEQLPEGRVTTVSAGGTTLAFTLDPVAIDATLRGLRRKGEDARAGRWASRAPPADPVATAA